jgi:hypothetical protein
MGRRFHTIALATLLTALPAAAAETPVIWDLQLQGTFTSAEAYAILAESWGFELALEPELPPVELRVDLQRVSRDEALGLLTIAARHFWWEDEGGVVHVARDTPAVREAAEVMVGREYRLQRAQPGEVVTALRSLASVRHVKAGADGVAVEIWEPRLVWMDRIVAAMEEPLPAEGVLHWLISERGLTIAAPDPSLGMERPRRLWFPRPEPRERLYQAIEARFRVDLVLDPSIVDPGHGTLRLEEATLFEALDALTVPAGRFWTPFGGRRIAIAEDTPQARARWEPLGLLALPLRHADPDTVRGALRRLEVRRSAAGSEPPVVLAMGTPAELATTRFVVETLEREAAAPVPTARLWLGTRNRPRLADAQLLVDPAVEDGRRRAFAAAGPPELRARPAAGPETVSVAARSTNAPGTAAAARSADAPDTTASGSPAPAAAPADTLRRPYLLPVLEEALGLHVGFETCHWPSNPRSILLEGPPAGGRLAVLRRLASEHELLWTVVGPDTVRLAPNQPYPARIAAQWGVAAVPLGAEPAALRARAEELGLEVTAEVSGRHPLLFAVGPWEALGELVAASEAAGEPNSRE